MFPKISWKWAFRCWGLFCAFLFVDLLDVGYLGVLAPTIEILYYLGWIGSMLLGLLVCIMIGLLLLLYDKAYPNV